MSEGMEPREAYSLRGQAHGRPGDRRDATRVAAFSPLLFWPGIVGEFMKYLPITLIATLSASLVVALIFTPTLGAMLGRAEPAPSTKSTCATAASTCAPSGSRSRRPLATLGVAVVLLVGVVQAYGDASATASSSSPTSSPTSASSRCARAATSRSRRRTGSSARSRSASSACRRSRPSMPAPARASAARDEVTEDTIGTIQFEFVDWQERRKASEILDEIRAETADIPGVIVEVTKPQGGPPTGKPITLQITSADPAGCSIPAAREGRRHRPRQSRHARRRRRPAAARHRLDARGRQGRGREIRRQPGRPSAPPCSSSPTA